ncbi:hypothetical protein DV702_08925 [Sporosarcina sp. PTS2304]|uniref:DUF3226 domain-containing protein n=1 Tax=Sporosarcina sp. PTS2304 TaxID=2283194 RepID=UPI000E0CE993|nr:DUF3226 domain-containing protein [Sporosarcina sp. PTS2304]AXH99847.1 hypothetical protein DV702_08925 [Sporosarcina sp. PTS2304]
MRIPNKVSKDSKMPFQIEKTKLLFVEGKDEVFFFDKLFKHLEIEDIQLVEIGGVEQMSVKLAAFMLIPDFESVKSIGFVRDADHSFDSAMQSMRMILENNGLQSSSNHGQVTQDESDRRIGIFIMPGENIEGTMLEDLCLHIIKERKYVELIDQYIVDLNKNELPVPSNLAKAKTQIYLASQRKIVHSIGLAAQKRYWDLTHPGLDEFKEFIKKL